MSKSAKFASQALTQINPKCPAMSLPKKPGAKKKTKKIQVKPA
jgi:hypothetical protein